jgi:hypothetical protein
MNFMFPTHKLYDECDAVRVVCSRHVTYIKDKETNSKYLCCEEELMVFNFSSNGGKYSKYTSLSEEDDNLDALRDMMSYVGSLKCCKICSKKHCRSRKIH